MSIQDIKVPDIGGDEKVEVIEVCVSPGDSVEADDSLVVLESDKASMEVPAPLAGKIVTVKLRVGDKVGTGDQVLTLEVLEASGESTESKDEEPSAVTAISAEEPPAKNESPVDNKSVLESIAVPDIGGAENVDVIEVCVSTGDAVAEGESLIVLESDKASMDIPAPFTGVVESIALKEGDKVSKDSTILVLRLDKPVATLQAKQSEANSIVEADRAVSSTVEEASDHGTVTSVAEIKASTSTAGNSRDDGHVYAGPAVRKLARELGVDLSTVNGTGPRSRILSDDVKGFVKQSLTSENTSSGSGVPTIADVDFSQFGSIEAEAMSKIGRLTAENMHRNWLNVPHVTQFDDANVDELEDFRQSLKAEAKNRDTKLTPLPFILLACAKALADNPKFNSSLQRNGEELVYKHYINIGIAVDTPVGLVVPVVKDVNKKTLWQLAEETAVLAEKAKNRKLSMKDMQGSCFTISSLGSIGGTGFTPIVNSPEVGILGVSKLAVKPVWNGYEFLPTKMLPLALSYDHRVINGADAGRFMTSLTATLADFRRVVL